jgi:hypothetical protein
MPSALPAWLALPVAVWCLARLLLVSPAETQLAHEQRVLLNAEHDLISQQVATERAELEVRQMETQAVTKLSDAQRLQAALTVARSELAHGTPGRSSDASAFASIDDDAGALELRREPG